jgi:hypothetical protein
VLVTALQPMLHKRNAVRPTAGPPAVCTQRPPAPYSRSCRAVASCHDAHRIADFGFPGVDPGFAVLADEYSTFCFFSAGFSICRWAATATW